MQNLCNILLFSILFEHQCSSSFIVSSGICLAWPERITTGCLHTSRKSCRIEACRWVHRVWWLISSLQLSNLSRCSCQVLRFKDATSTSHSVYGGRSRLSGWLICTKMMHKHVEGWHNRLKKMAWKAHPNLFEFIQKEQAAGEVTTEQLSGAGRVRAKKRKVVRHEETIKKLMEEFTGGTRNLKSFLCHYVLSFDYYLVLNPL